MLKVTLLIKVTSLTDENLFVWSGTYFDLLQTNKFALSRYLFLLAESEQGEAWQRFPITIKFG